MRTITVSTLAILVAALFVMPGCVKAPPEDASKATVTEAKPVEAPAAPAEAAPAEAAPAAPAEAAPAAPAPAEAAPAAPAPAEAAPATPVEAAPAAATAFKVEPNDNTSIMFTGYKPLAGMQGGFGEFSGTVDVPGGNVEQTAASITIKMASVFTENDILTDVLKTPDFFGVEAHPEAKFVTTSVKKAETGYTVEGNFEFLGKNLGITFPADIQVSDKGVTIKAEFTLDRTQWGMSTAGWKDSIINNEVLINLDVLAAPAS
ncbi:MAG: YceI family protein [Candidatus Hydrogenedentes bacterium]|nr:YceI family protein [Candidatus Hydrogenedentota bacterium]